MGVLLPIVSALFTASRSLLHIMGQRFAKAKIPPGGVRVSVYPGAAPIKWPRKPSILGQQADLFEEEMEDWYSYAKSSPSVWVFRCWFVPIILCFIIFIATTYLLHRFFSEAEIGLFVI